MKNENLDRGSNLKCSIDLDDTTLKYPNIIIPFMKLLQKSGHTVGILTGRSTWDVSKILPSFKRVGFKPDFVITSDNQGYVVRGRNNIEEIWKPKMIDQHKIDVHLDNAAARMHPKHGIALVIK